MQLQGFKLFVEAIGLTSIYVDSCVWNRQYDDQGQESIRRETEALKKIIALVLHGEIRLIFSQVLQEEMSRHPDIIKDVSQLAKEFIPRTSEIDERGVELVKNFNFGSYDALHIASAESAGVDFLVTVDYRMIKRANRANCHVRLINPLEWLKNSGFENRARGILALANR